MNQLREMVEAFAALQQRIRTLEQDQDKLIVDQLSGRICELRRLCGFNKAPGWVRTRWRRFERMSHRRDLIATLVNLALRGLTVSDFIVARSDYFTQAALHNPQLIFCSRRFPDRLWN